MHSQDRLRKHFTTKDCCSIFNVLCSVLSTIVCPFVYCIICPSIYRFYTRVEADDRYQTCMTIYFFKYDDSLLIRIKMIWYLSSLSTICQLICDLLREEHSDGHKDLTLETAGLECLEYLPLR